MPVDSTHPEYDKRLEAQSKCRDAFEGEQQVKSKDILYLPLLSGMSKESDKYKAYLSRAMFYSATRRTVEGLTGVVDRKPPVLNIMKGWPWEDDINGNGISLHSFANQIVNEAVLIGWQGIFDDRRKGYDYPYPVQYMGEQIINWSYRGTELEMVMLSEIVHERSEDGYEISCIQQWRELSIVNGAYIVIIWRKKLNEGKEEFYVHNAYTPTIRGKFLETIPFVFVSPENKLENPPLLDMVEVNFHHYKNSADYEHGLHFTGLPTPYITGLGEAKDKNGSPVAVQLGSETILMIPSPQGSAGFMEVSGDFNALVVAMENKKLEMASLGARLLQNEKKAVETAETSRINKSGDSNIISSIVTGAENGLNAMLAIMSIWESLAKDANTIELNRDYLDEGMTAQDLTAMVSAWQSRAISHETLLYNVQKRDMLQDGRTIEEEIAAIESEAPTLTE